MNRRQRRRQNRAADLHPRTGQRISDLGSTQLQQTLVQDALTGYETPLAWFVAACRRIARLDRITEEDAFQRVRGEVSSLGGFLPGGTAGPRSVP